MTHKSWLGLALLPVLSSTAFAQDVDFSGDLRFGFASLDREDRNGLNSDDSQFNLRVRAGMQWNISEIYSAKIRVAATGNDSDFSGDLKFYTELPAGASSIEPGDMTIDELYVRARYGNWDHKVGRFQFSNALVGVPAKSMSRMNSNSWNVSWTDGLHSQFSAGDGWKYNFIIEHATEDGPTTVRRSPLNYQSSQSRATYYASVDKSDEDGLFLQRSVDVTVIPSALYYNGVAAGDKTDYVAVSARLGLQWALRGESRFVAGVEVGHAPDTPTSAAMGLPGSGDSDGNAWQISLNVMDLAPGHSIGLVHGENDAGWLLSTDFTNNQSLTEFRYNWRPMSGHLFQFRLREREDLIQRSTAVRKRNDVDYYIRYSISL